MARDVDVDVTLGDVVVDVGCDDGGLLLGDLARGLAGDLVQGWDVWKTTYHVHISCTYII